MNTLDCRLVESVGVSFMMRVRVSLKFGAFEKESSWKKLIEDELMLDSDINSVSIFYNAANLSVCRKNSN